MRLVACLLAASVVSANQCGLAGPSGETTLTGEWGGAHAALVLKDAGGTIEYDCAHGTLDAPVRPDARGAFEVAGTHVREHGGPVRVDEKLEAVPARYVGQVSGAQLMLRVFAAADTLGPFTLTRGAAAQVFKCL